MRKDLKEKTFLIYPYWNVNIVGSTKAQFEWEVSNLSILECKSLSYDTTIFNKSRFLIYPYWNVNVLGHISEQPIYQRF